MKKTVFVTKTTNGKLPGLPFERMKNAVLGETYELSLVFAGNHRMHSLNKKYRRKNYKPNTLSFSLTETSGEIFINTDRIRIEAKQYGLSERGYIALLFIHGLFHLKGMEHSATMEQKEQEILNRFRIR